MPARFVFVSPLAVLSVSGENIRKAIGSIPPTSGADPSGLLLNQPVPLFICGAGLVALRKPNGSFRPVATSETLRRVQAKVLVEQVASFQLGVRTANGCEAIVHTTRQQFARNRDAMNTVAIRLDITNALNIVDRIEVMRRIRRTCPEAAPWLDRSSAPSHLSVAQTLPQGCSAGRASGSRAVTQ